VNDTVGVELGKALDRLALKGFREEVHVLAVTLERENHGVGGESSKVGVYCGSAYHGHLMLALGHSRSS
jgi:hypothetical protein